MLGPAARIVRSAPGPGVACRTSRRSFGWTEEDVRLSFKVKADNFNVQKLAGGVLLRCEQRLETQLEPMGSRSVYNCVKALVLANRFAEEAREKRGSDEDTVARIGFVPSFARTEGLQWMRLQVIAVGVRPADAAVSRPDVSGLESPNLKVGMNTDLQKLQNAILANWMQRCAGGRGDPVLSAMGEASVSRAVKGAAFALRELSKRGSGARPFVCFPAMEQVLRSEERQQTPGEKQTVTVLRLENRPSWGDRGPRILVRTAPEPRAERRGQGAEGSAP